MERVLLPPVRVHHKINSEIQKRAPLKRIGKIFDSRPEFRNVLFVFCNSSFGFRTLQCSPHERIQGRISSKEFRVRWISRSPLVNSWIRWELCQVLSRTNWAAKESNCRAISYVLLFSLCQIWKLSLKSCFRISGAGFSNKRDVRSTLRIRARTNTRRALRLRSLG